MKILVNKCYGGMSFSKSFHEKYGYDIYDKKRNDNELIAAVEEFGVGSASGNYACLQIKTIPDEATDWEIVEHDGFEDVIYVLDGRLCWA